MKPTKIPAAFIVLSLCFPVAGQPVGDKAAQHEKAKYQITGLFAVDREQDLREAFDKMPQIKLLSIDFQNAEAVMEFDAAKLFPKANPEQKIQQLDGMLRNASNHTFGIKRLRTVPLEKLKMVEIVVAGLDCKACCLAAYEAIYKMDGVERATASFREGRVTALIDPEKTNVAQLKDALMKRGVQLKAP